MRRWVGMVLVLVWGTGARANYTPGALAIDSHEVYIGRLVGESFTQEKGSMAGIGTVHVHVLVEEVIKGDGKAGDEKVFDEGNGIEGMYDRQIAAGEVYLICVGVTIYPYSGARDFAYAIPLSAAAATTGGTLSVLTMGAQPMTPRELVGRLREEVARLPAGGPSAELFIGDGTTVENVPALIMPDDGRLSGAIEQWLKSDRGEMRDLAVSAMRLRDVPHRIADLERLRLSDPLLIDTFRAVTPWWRPYYPIRIDADEALKALGADVRTLPAAELMKPDGLYRRTYGEWLALAGVICSAGAYVSQRRRKVGVWVSMMRIGAVWSLGALGVLAVGWHRSESVADDFLWARPPVILSVTSYRGGVQLLVGTEATAASPLVHAALVPDGWVDTFMRGSPSGHGIYFWHGFGTEFLPHAPAFKSVTGYSHNEPAPCDNPAATPGPWEPPPQVTIRSWVIPYRDVWPVTLMIPVVAALQWGWAVMRRRGRRGAGLCAACGFDVRTQLEMKGGRCPECGGGVS